MLERSHASFLQLGCNEFEKNNFSNIVAIDGSRDRWLCHLLSKTSTFHNIIDSYDLPVSNIFLMTATQTIEKNVI